MPLIRICHAAGFGDLSNLNSQFLAQKGVALSRFRAMVTENKTLAEAA